jgi:N-acetyl-gamma-glutamyl-phosphate reductase common form
VVKRFRAAILGGSGFAGAELCRRLFRHPAIEIARVGAADHVGELLSSAIPSLEGQTSLRFENPSAEEAVADVDVVVMGVPPEVSLSVVEAALAAGVRVIDLSGAFRLKSAARYAEFYGREHPRPDLLERFVYGLPELFRDQIRGARLVASPGCFATTIELGLLPLCRAGLVEGPIQVVAATGSSGSGASPSLTTHHPVRAGNLRVYRPLSHQHVPEIEETLGAAGARDLSLAFVPVSAPLVRGILATAFVRVPEGVSEDELRTLQKRAYRDEPFVRVPEARLPEVVAVSGSPFCEVGLVLGKSHPSGRLVTVVSALDNLIKGGAGQAVQNLNLMLGLPETTTLEDLGPFP